MPEAAPGEIPWMKIESKTVPEYCVVKLPVAEMLCAHVADEPIIKTEIFRIGYQAAS